MNIETRLDQKRGCGWRKPGGLYMVAGGMSAGCERLPIPLHICPTCHQGIKPTRGFAWIDTVALIGPKAGKWCQADWCAECPVGGSCGRHGLIWIGGAFYKRPEDFTREAATQGVSRRISAVPKDFKVGETWILVAHREAILKRAAIVLDGEAKDAEYEPGIFHAFKPSAIEYVVKGDETAEELERMRKRGITPVQIVRVGDQPELDSGAEEDETVLEEVEAR